MERGRFRFHGAVPGGHPPGSETETREGIRSRSPAYFPLPWASYQALLPGRFVVDGIQLLRGSFVKMENYSLGSVAASVLGETKTITGHDRGAEILFQYENDLEHFIEYKPK